MRYQYLIYPSALDKLEKSGIKARVAEVKASEDGLPYQGGHISEFQVKDTVDLLVEIGLYKKMPKSFRNDFTTLMNRIFEQDDGVFWSITKPSGVHREPCELDDLSLFVGDIAHIVLEPDEIWDYEKFGFSSPNELVTTVGAYIIQESRSMHFREGYKWVRSAVGSDIETEITGDMNADMRIYQTDLSHYDVLDPYGNPIGVRPITRSDRKVVAAYHSTEAILFTAILKYIDQFGITSELLQDAGKPLLDYSKSLGQGGGFCTEHFGGFDSHPSHYMVEFTYPIPQLDKYGCCGQYPVFHLTKQFDGSYAVYLDHNGDFILSGNYKEDKKPIDARFIPSDVDHLLKGILYQCAAGLGRTSARQIMSILHYRFSDEFEKDKESWKEREKRLGLKS